jgi:hypothetical protein
MKTSVYGMQQHLLFAGLRINVITESVTELIFSLFSRVYFNCFVIEVQHSAAEGIER